MLLQIIPYQYGKVSLAVGAVPPQRPLPPRRLEAQPTLVAGQVVAVVGTVPVDGDTRPVEKGTGRAKGGALQVAGLVPRPQGLQPPLAVLEGQRLRP